MSFIAVEDRQASRLAEAIQQRVGHQRYQVWFHNSTRFECRNDSVEIAVPNDFISEWIGTHFQKMIQDAATEVMGCHVPVRFNVMPQLFDAGAKNSNGQKLSNTNESSSTRLPPQRERYVNGRADINAPIDFTPDLTRLHESGASLDLTKLAKPRQPSDKSLNKSTGKPPMRQPVMAEVGQNGNSHHANGHNGNGHNGIIHNGTLSPSTSVKARLRHDLETYVVGPGNQLSYNAAIYVAEFPGAQYNPLFIHGSCGLGKTHLLQGLCRQFVHHHPTKKWLYVTGEEFTNEFLLALRNNRVDAFRRKMRDLDLLAIDDVHFLSGKKATQEEFLHTFNAIEAMGRQVVLASDEHPKMIAEFGESLINRFVSGMVVRIDCPNYNMRCEILRAISVRNRINLGEEVIAWVSRRVTQNVRELEGAITRITAHTRLTGRPVDVSLAQEALGDLDRQLVAPVKPESVLTSVCHYFGLEMKELMSGRRQRTISLARSVAMFLVRKTSKLSFPEIAMKMGKRNHSTVISACRRIERASARNERLAWCSHLGERE
ncbi:MAG: chromosomal replication initiator protein DnaA, partial [Burkholderiales bacterium]|nr:chromosomal replication initiator protein DnaA [Phycisphaerae bacterium]